MLDNCSNVLLVGCFVFMNGFCAVICEYLAGAEIHEFHCETGSQRI
jgi:hypothetical protein